MFSNFYPTPAVGARGCITSVVIGGLVWICGRMGASPSPFITSVDRPEGGLIAYYAGSVVSVIASIVRSPVAAVAGPN